SAFVYDPGNGDVYATVPSRDSVLVVNPQTESIVDPPIPVGYDPNAITFDPASNNVFVANSGSSNITVINAGNNRVSIANVPVGSEPVALVDDPADGLVFVANAGSSYLSVLTADNPAAGLPTIVLFSGPADGLAYSARSGKVVATEPASTYATIIDASTRTVVTSVAPVGKDVIAAVTSANQTEFVLGNSTFGDLIVLNSTVGTSVGARISVDSDATQLVLDPQAGAIYCWTSGAHVLEKVNLSSDVATAAAPATLAPLNSVTYLATGSRVLSSSGNESLIYSIDSTRLGLSSPVISASSSPLSILADPFADRFYVGTFASLDAYNGTSDQFITSVHDLDGNSTQLALDHPNNLLWLANSLSGVVAVNLTTLQVAVATGLPVSPNCADGIAVDPSSSAVFVLTSPTTIRVLNSTNGDVLLSSVTVGSNVTSIAYDPADNQVYAAGDQVSLLNGSSFQVDFPPVAIGVSHRVLGEIYEPSRKDVYIASVGLLPGEQGIVSVLDGSSGAATEGSLVEIPVGESPVAFGIVTPGNTSTPGSAMVWVANELSGTVSVISSPPEITSFSSSPSTIDLGFPTTILVTYQGGAGESDVSYGGLPSGCSSASKLMVNCTPNVSGTFILAVNLTDSFGFSANATTGLIVESSLAVRTSFSPSTLPNIDPGIPLRGTAAASDGSPPYSFSWSFSDGNVSSGPSVSHSFSLPGVFVVTAEVRDSTGATNTSSSTVVVVASPSAAVSVNPGNVTDVNIPLVFKGTITGGVGTVRQNWSFADGTTSLGPNATHTWTRAGNYTVDFSSSDALGVMSSRSLDVRVNPSLTATFGSNGGSASNPSAPATPVTFTSNASGGTRPYNVEWSFGDESSSPGLTVNHSYATSGTYSVKVTLSDSVGASVSTNLTVVVAQSSNSSGGLSSLSGGFGSGLFLGLVAGGVLAAAVLFTVGLRKGARPPAGPVSPYVPP
ncbi:MAG: PKD domain-containing protein, partial [Thermoplasmata archaeon]